MGTTAQKLAYLAETKAQLKSQIESQLGISFESDFRTFVDVLELFGNVTLTSIPASAFRNCYGLTSITIPNSVTSIEQYAFDNCSKLTSVTIPNSVTSIGSVAFRDCIRLASIAIPDSVTSIGSAAFRSCTGLTSITIPDSVTSISSRLFYECVGLTSVTIPDSVTSIGNGAFNSCTSLTSIVIPNSVTSIGDYALSYCTSLEYIYFNGYESEWNSISKGQDWDEEAGDYEVICWSEGLTFTSNGDGTCYVSGIGTCTDTSLVIPTKSPDGDSVTSIGSGAFQYCTQLTSITIPNGVTDIGWNSFEGCSGLTSIIIPNTVTVIGEYAFNECASLAYAKILPTLPPYPSYNRRWYAFDSTNDCPIYVPMQSVDDYKSEDGWSRYASRIQAIPQE